MFSLLRKLRCEIFKHKEESSAYSFVFIFRLLHVQDDHRDPSLVVGLILHQVFIWLTHSLQALSSSGPYR